MILINLIPEETQRAQARRRRLARWAVSIAVAALACAIPLIAHWTQHSRVDELRRLSDHLQADLLAARAELKNISAQAQELVLRSERAKALREKRSWSSVLALIASCLPSECWLTSLATDPPVPGAAPLSARKPAPPGASRAAPVRPVGQAEKPALTTIDAPRKLRIVGNASESTQPLAFVARLKESHAFREVLLERTNRQGDDPAAAFKFEVLCEW